MCRLAAEAYRFCNKAEAVAIHKAGRLRAVRLRVYHHGTGKSVKEAFLQKFQLSAQLLQFSRPAELLAVLQIDKLLSRNGKERHISAQCVRNAAVLQRIRNAEQFGNLNAMSAGMCRPGTGIGIGAVGSQNRVQLPDHANPLLPVTRGKQLRSHARQCHAPDIVQSQRPHPFFHKRRGFFLTESQLRRSPNRIGIAVNTIRNCVKIRVCALFFRPIIRVAHDCITPAPESSASAYSSGR